MNRYLSLSLAALLTLATAADAAAADFPYELETGREVTILAGSVVVYGGGYLVGRHQVPLTEEEIGRLDPMTINRFDRGATRNWSPGAARASDIMAGVTMVAPFSLALGERTSSENGTLGLMYLETLLLQGSLSNLAKNIFSRTRPYAYNDDPSIPMAKKTEMHARRSFYSGHTSSAFASMVFLAGVYGKMYPDSDAKGWVWGGCMTAAATTGYLRYAAGRHYPSDILVGAVMGAAVGWLIPYLHETESATGGSGGAKVQLAWGFGF